MSSTTGRSERSTRSSRRAAAQPRSQQSSDLFQDPLASSQPSHVAMEAIADVPEPTGLHTSELNADATNLSEPLAYNYGSELGTEAVTEMLPTEINAQPMSSTTGAPMAVVWGTDVNIAHVMDQFKHFLMEYILHGTVEELSRGLSLGLRNGRQVDLTKPYYLQRVEDLAFAPVIVAADATEAVVEVDCAHVQEYSPALYKHIMLYPLEVIPALDSAAQQVYMERCRENNLTSVLDRAVLVRIFHCDRTRALRALSPDDLDQVVSVSGMVIRLSGLIVEMTRAHFRCLVCRHVLEVVCEQGRVQEPHFCHHCHAAHTYDLVHNACTFINKQMIKLQESPEDMPAGQTPHTVVLYVSGSMTDCVTPGDRVTVTGVYRAQPLRVVPTQRTLKAVHKTYVDALHFQRQSSDRLRLEGSEANFTEERTEEILALSQKPDLYERLSSAIAPSIYENEDVKKGILLQLFAGTHKDFSSVGRSEARSEINILLCGDPGTSKSQLLQYVFHLVPRAQYTSGKGSSAVGLTAFVAKDPETRQLTLQTGALVLADQGVCCIDEFDKMSDATRSVLHEVMEQQTLSIAKAGIICQLHARTSVLAAANPINSKWDPQRTIIDNIQLPHTLLSRFDLIFLILDPLDETYDARLARHLVALYSATPEVAKEEGLSRDLLRDYICYAKSQFQPRLTEAAAHYLVEEYLQMRSLGAGRGQVSAYPRQLESLIRLAEAHARMRLSQEVTTDDCREARRLQREALKQAAVDPGTGLIDVSILATGVSSTMRKRREEVAQAVWTMLEERGRVGTFHLQRVFEDLRTRSERLISRELFEDGLNLLKNENKIEWSGNTIRKL